MNNTHKFLIPMASGAIALLLAILAFRRVEAQVAPFLISPYYGEAVITQGYSAGHQAYDFGLNYATVLASEGGTIESVGWYNNGCHHDGGQADCGFGLHVIIRHSNNYRTIYGHLSSVLADQGATVQQGQIIGTSGNTGWSTGPHLHFQVQRFVNNLWVNVDPFASGSPLWKDGQWANPSRPLPAPSSGGEIIVDDTADNTGGFSKGENDGVTPPPFNNACQNNCANWTTAAAGYGNPADMYHTLVNGTTHDSWAKWQPSGLPVGGSIYEIFVYAPSVNATTWQARYTVKHTFGQTTAMVDQNGLNDQWVSIGAYHMEPGNYVYLTDATGETYRVHCYSATGSNLGQNYCQVGADAIKFVRRGTTYLPDARASESWTSGVVVRSNGGAVKARASFFDLNGLYQCGSTSDIPGQGSYTFTPCAAAVSGVVDASGDVSVVVRTQHTSGKSYAYNGVPASAGDPAFRAGQTIYTPLALARYGSWHTKISVLNTGAASANISITYYNQNGSVNRTVQKSALAPNASQIYDADADFGAQFTGSAKVSSNQNIAVVVKETEGNMTGVYNGVSGGGKTVRVPLALRGWNGWQTSLQVQNLEASSTTATIRYYDSNGANPQTVAHTIESRGFWNAPLTLTQWSGVAVVSSSNTNVAVEVDEYNPVGYLQSYTGLGWATATAYLPQVTNSNNWVTGVQIQNAGSAVSQVRVTVNGVYKWQGDINPNGWYNWSATAEGSAVVQSLNGKPLVVMVDIYNAAGNDRLMSYTGDNR